MGLMNMTGLTVYESVPVEEQVTKLLQSRKPTNTVDATFIRGQVPASIGKEASSMWPADIEVQVPGELILGKYFAARLPAPDSMAGHDGEKLPSPTAASETTSDGQTADESPAGSSDSDAL